MASEEPDANPLVIRRSDLSIEYSTSKLLKRGLSALDAPRIVCLEVVDLIAFETSVFVLSDNWDAQATEPHGAYDDNDDVDTVKQKRRVILYEFHRTGEYVRKLYLPLIKLTDEGYARIKNRYRGRVTVRSDFIHFSESFSTDEPQDANRIDYLFSRDGKRLAAWTNNAFVDRYRKEEESLTPRNAGIHPRWITNDMLVEIKPGDALSQAHYVIYSEVRTLSISAASPVTYTSDDGGQFSILQDGLAKCVPIKIPIETYPYGLGRPIYPWELGECNPLAIWFLTSSLQNVYENDIAWRLVMTREEPEITIFPLPSPYDLLESGIITVPNGWRPSESSSDCGSSDEQDRSWSFANLEFYSWEDSLVMVYRAYGGPNGDWVERALLLKVENGALVPIKSDRQ